LVRLPSTHTVSSKFWKTEKKKEKRKRKNQNWNWQLASSRTSPKPDYIVSGSFLNELKNNSRILFWLVGFTQVRPVCYFEENNSGINFV
jgi:hypothetical protein